MASEIKYDIVEEIYHFDEKRRTSYGIAAYDTDVSTVLASVHDISSDMCEIGALAHKCNELELSIEHLDNVVDDILNDHD